MKPDPVIITFTNCTGGVDRTVALLNVAYQLAGWGRRVLVLDMDLEAPGISHYLCRPDELADADRSDEDILDLLVAMLDVSRSEEAGEPYAASIRESGRDLDACIVSAAPAGLAAMKPTLGYLGCLDFVVPRVMEDYDTRLERLDLGRLGRDELVRAGEALRVHLETRTVAVAQHDCGEPEHLPYDYVLVDSPSGTTEAGGLCVGPLADRLVILTALTDQDVTDTGNSLRVISIEPREWNRPGDPRWDDRDVPPEDAQAPRRLGPKPTILVASPVPAGEIAQKDRRIQDVEKRIGPVAAHLSYDSKIALAESNFVRDHPDEDLAREYRHLTGLIMAAVSDHAEQLGPRVVELWGENRRDEAVDAAVRLTPQDPWLGQSLLRQLADAMEQQDVPFAVQYSVCDVLTQEGASDRHVAFSQWGTALSNQAMANEGAEADRLFEAGYEKYEAALEIKADFHEALTNWGSALSDQAMTKAGSEADRLFGASCEKFEAALEIKPDYARALCNQACAAALRGRTEDCRRVLGQWLDTDVGPDAEELDDPDFDAVRNLPWFRDAIHRLTKADDPPAG